MGVREILDNLKIVSNKQKKERLDICNSCDQLTSLRTCSFCGCFMDAKVQFKGSSCPDNRWLEQQ